MSLGNLDRYHGRPAAGDSGPAQVAAAYVPPGPSGVGEEVSLQEILQVLRRRWPVVASITMAAFVVAGVITLLQTPIYRSQTTLLVEQHKGGDARPDSDGLLGDLMGLTQARSVETQVEILRSDTLQLGALADVSPPLAKLPEKQRPRLAVESVKDTDLIKIRVEDPKPLLAAQVANALTARYIRQNTELNRQTASTARQFVERQMGKIQSDLRRAEERLRDFRERSGAVSLDDETSDRIDRLADAEAARAQAMTEREALRAQIAEIRRQLKNTQVRLIASSNFASNPVVAELQTEIAKLEMQRAGLLKEYTPQAPEVTAIQAQIESARTRIQSEMGKVLSDQQETINPIYQETLQQYAALQAQSLAQAARVNGLERAIQTGYRALRALPAKQLELAELTRNATELGKTFEMLDAKYQELRVQEAAALPNARVVDPAQPGLRPVRPIRSLNLMLGGLIGAMLGFGLVFFQEQLDNTLKSPEELERFLGIPPLGVVALVKDPSQRLITQADSRSGVAEMFRMIRSSIQFASVGAPVRSLMVTSARPGEGKSTTAANLAIVMAQKGLRVILIDCDLRRPTVHKAFKISNSVGLTTAVVGMAQPEEVLFRSPVENLCVVPAGPLPPNPAELLDSARAREVFERYRAVADLVVFDTPPCTALADASVLAAQVDGVVLVIHGSQTDRRAAQRAVQLLRDAGTRVFGAVLNKVNLERESYYYQYYYQYYSYYGDPETAESGSGKRSKKKHLVERMLEAASGRKGDS